MSAISELIESVKQIDALLSDQSLEPRPERDDFHMVKETPLLVAYLASKESRDAGEALRKEAVFKDAVVLFKADRDNRTGLDSYLFSRIAEDAELLQITEKVFEQPETELELVIKSRLAGDNEMAKLRLEIFRARGR